MLMYLDPAHGLVERCDLCGRSAEVDDAEDARGWGINHHAAFHDGGDA